MGDELFDVFADAISPAPSAEELAELKAPKYRHRYHVSGEAESTVNALATIRPDGEGGVMAHDDATGERVDDRIGVIWPADVDHLMDDHPEFAAAIIRRFSTAEYAAQY
jgi:hypothetical protein